MKATKINRARQERGASLAGNWKKTFLNEIIETFLIAMLRQNIFYLPIAHIELLVPRNVFSCFLARKHIVPQGTYPGFFFDCRGWAIIRS
ncbi:hypothetical protein FCL47_16550 [Desulfopila sp. IMCC35006]|uniref:hypothetical protein n=1 Tax=Desulfopila sp. IMCC35006 TaxID=2569542 RepID=UPI0010ACE6C4|nr:hypothetical protein [Desulfopila sp. IMCC35006]TKB24851.1 hypothetical protein FCL47_16550 [Desulfopila sp. IMCC35006]